jgi:hypothetical protein
MSEALNFDCRVVLFTPSATSDRLRQRIRREQP